jgi:membrane fusion protein, multidrug efflux system
MAMAMTETETTPRRSPNGDGDKILTPVPPTRTHANGKDATVTEPTVKQPAAGRPFYTKRPFQIFFIILFLLAVAATAYYLHARHFETTDDAFIDGHIIPVSPQVAALVAAVHVDDNQLVHKGDLLVELDPTDYQVALAQAQGSEAAAKGKLDEARSSVAAAQSEVTLAQAELDSAQVSARNADRDWQRMQNLSDQAKSQQQTDNAEAAQKTDAAMVAQMQAKLVSAQTQVASAQASVIAAEGDYEKAQADTKRAEINLGYCKIIAPEDGRVTSKSVEPGMYITTSSQLFILVPTNVWIVANFKETQLDRMRVGQKVTIAVDAYPDHEFTGTVQSLQAGTGSRFSVIPAENATGNFVKVVQRVPVKITIDGDVNSDPDHLLAPGMSVEPTVRVSEGDF